MAKYQRRPSVTEAEQYWGREPLPKGVCTSGHERSQFAAEHVHTAHGQTVTLQIGDWVLPEPDGRGYYPVKADIFAATYEPVGE